MKTGKSVKKTQDSFGTVLYWTVGGLLILTMVSVWLVSGLFAKYTASDLNDDSARVANTGVEKFELWEHKATPDGNGYKLDQSTEVSGNKYENVHSNMDIPKDPFIRLVLKDSEVDYELFVQITESNPFPDYVTYEIADGWELYDADNGIYKYKGYFDAATPYNFTNGNEIHILKGDMLHIGENYVGNDQEFSLSFEAWLTQVD